MQDRISANPGQYTLQHADGSNETVILSMKDSPQVPGTPFCKRTMLTDETAKALQLSLERDPTPNDAFAQLAKLIPEVATALANANFALDVAQTAAKTSSKVTFENFTNTKGGVKRAAVQMPDSPLEYVRDAVRNKKHILCFYAGETAKQACAYDVDTRTVQMITAPTFTRDRDSECVCPYNGTFSIYGYNSYDSRHPEFGNGTELCAYNFALTQSTPAPLSTPYVQERGIGVAGTNTLFAGGSTYLDRVYTVYDVIDVYDSKLTKLSSMRLYREQALLRNCNVGDTLVFNCGWDADEVRTKNRVVITPSLTMSTPLEDAWYIPVGSVGDYGIFENRTNGGYMALSSALVQQSITTPTLEANRQGHAFSANFMLIAGGTTGRSSSVEYYDTVEGYSKNLTLLKFPNLSTPMAFDGYPYAECNGVFLFVTGRTGETPEGVYVYTKSVETYEEVTGYAVTIPALSKYKFQDDSTEQLTMEEKKILGGGPLNGYILRGGFTLSGEN